MGVLIPNRDKKSQSKRTGGEDGMKPWDHGSQKKKKQQTDITVVKQKHAKKMGYIQSKNGQNLRPSAGTSAGAPTGGGGIDIISRNKLVSRYKRRVRPARKRSHINNPSLTIHTIHTRDTNADERAVFYHSIIERIRYAQFARLCPGVSKMMMDRRWQTRVQSIRWSHPNHCNSNRPRATHNAV